MKSLKIKSFAIVTALVSAVCVVSAFSVKAGEGTFGTLVLGSKGGSGTIMPCSEKSPDKRNTINLGFDFGTTTETAHVFVGVLMPIPEHGLDLDSLNYYAKGELNGHRLCVQVQDAKGIWFSLEQEKVGLRRADWQRYKIDLKKDAAGSWNNPENATKVTLPLKTVRLVIQFTNMSSRQGEIMLSTLKGETTATK